jgi:hypothetical protein
MLDHQRGATLSTEDPSATGPAKSESQAALLVVGLIALYALAVAAAIVLFLLPWVTAAVGAVWAGVQWSSRRAPGIFRAISIIWGVGLLVLGVAVGLAG